MALKIRLSRGGAKKNPHYRIVVADSRSPRDGRFIERVGTYHPLQPRDDAGRVTMDLDRIRYWMQRGAHPTDRIQRLLVEAGVLERPAKFGPAPDTPAVTPDTPAVTEDAPAPPAA